MTMTMAMSPVAVAVSSMRMAMGLPTDFERINARNRQEKGHTCKCYGAKCIDCKASSSDDNEVHTSIQFYGKFISSFTCNSQTCGLNKLWNGF